MGFGVNSLAVLGSRDLVISGYSGFARWERTDKTNNHSPLPLQPSLLRLLYYTIRYYTTLDDTKRYQTILNETKRYSTRLFGTRIQRIMNRSSLDLDPEA